MAMTESEMLELGTVAPPFSLPHVDGGLVSLEDFEGVPALLVMFICNHCPFVIHIREQLASLGTDYRARGVGVVAINSNDVSTHPADAPPAMREEVARWGYTFPYLFDESQSVAKSYRAACTPDFYVFDADRRLVYRGQLDASRPGNDKRVDGVHLRTALDAVLAGVEPGKDQTPSVGCNIKWRTGNAPDYYR